MKISKKTTLLAGTILSVCLISGVVAFVVLSTPPPATYPVQKTVRYSFNVENETGSTLSDARVRIYAPVKQTATQRVIDIEASHPYDMVVDEQLNQVMHFKFEKIAPHETRIIRIQVRLEMADRANNFTAVDPDNFLNEENRVEVSNPDLQATAGRLKSATSLDTSIKTYDWVSNHMQYAGYIREDRGALYALKHGSGDCTEYSALYTALSRANRIPSRRIGGYVYPNSATLKPRDYHNWSENHIDGKWRIIDPQKENFENNQSHYIAIRVITGQPENARDNTHRFAYADPGINVVMN